jgi:hypothetical protein
MHSPQGDGSGTHLKKYLMANRESSLQKWRCAKVKGGPHFGGLSGSQACLDRAAVDEDQSVNRILDYLRQVMEHTAAR